MDGLMPTMKSGDILGHEFMGEVVEVGQRLHQVQEGRPDRRSLQHQLRRVPAVQARQLFRVASAPTATPRWRPSSSATRRPACSAIRT